MAKHKQPDKPIEFPKPDKHEEIIIPIDPEEPIVIPKESPDFIPAEKPVEVPPYEIIIPEEGP